MPSLTPPAKVLVTGSNGFVTIWIVCTLLEHGFTVRGTVRSDPKIPHIRSVFEDAVSSGRLEFAVVSDFLAPDAFAAAVRGVDAIVHTASPVHLNADDPNELIEPAVKGTLGVLESALKHAGPQLKRVVITSSTAAVANAPFSGAFDENSWNEYSISEVREKGKAADQMVKYSASKTLAEKAAWDFTSNNNSNSDLTWDLVTICMPYVFGPILSEVPSPAALNTSMSWFYDALFRTDISKDLANKQGEWVDVRDVAEGHVRALEVAEASGQRFILSSGPWIWQDWYDRVNELKIPGLAIPTGVPDAGKNFAFRYRYDASKARRVLAMTFRDKLSTAGDIIHDFKTRGWVYLNFVH